MNVWALKRFLSIFRGEARAHTMYRFAGPGKIIGVGTQAELIYETSVTASPNATQLASYAGRFVMIRHWDDPKESDLLPWLQIACDHAQLLVRLAHSLSRLTSDAHHRRLIQILPFGFWETGLGLPEFGIPTTYKFSLQCPAVTVSTGSRDLILAFLNTSTASHINATVIEDGGDSPLRTWRRSGWFWFLSVASAAFSCGVSAVGFIKLFEYWKYSSGPKICIHSPRRNRAFGPARCVSIP